MPQLHLTDIPRYEHQHGRSLQQHREHLVTELNTDLFRRKSSLQEAMTCTDIRRSLFRVVLHILLIVTERQMYHSSSSNTHTHPMFLRSFSLLTQQENNPEDQCSGGQVSQSSLPKGHALPTRRRVGNTEPDSPLANGLQSNSLLKKQRCSQCKAVARRISLKNVWYRDTCILLYVF